MICRRAILALAIAAGPLGAAPERVNFFATGDRIPGRVTAVTDGLVRLHSPVLAEPADIELAKLLEIRGEVDLPDLDAGHEAVVTLTNGNVLRGRLGALDDDSVVLDTWYAGRLELRRVMVDSLQVNDHGDGLYRGPDGPEGWVVPGGREESPAWRFSGGTMISRGIGGVARDLGMPDRVAISFDLAWRSNLAFRLILFSNEIDSENPSNGYMLNFDRQQAVLTKQFTDGTATHRSSIGRANIPELGSREKVRVELLADRRDGRFLLKINGKLLQINGKPQEDPWQDRNAGFAKMGGAIHFVAESGTPTRVSRIRIHRWDGQAGLQQGAGVEEDLPEPGDGQQRIRLRNGDLVSGRVLGVEEERLLIETAHGEVRLPVNRMTSAMLHRETDKRNPKLYQKPKLEAGDVRAWFAEGGSVVFRLEAVEEDHFVGFSQTFGTARFRRDAFHRVEFNIYKAELEPLRPSSSAW